MEERPTVSRISSLDFPRFRESIEQRRRGRKILLQFARLQKNQATIALNTKFPRTTKRTNSNYSAVLRRNFFVLIHRRAIKLVSTATKLRHENTLRPPFPHQTTLLVLQVNGKDVANKEQTENLFAETKNAVTILVSRCLYQVRSLCGLLKYEAKKIEVW